MADDPLHALASRLGVSPPDHTDGFDWSLPITRALVARGANIVIHLDGERSADQVTVVLSGPPLGDGFIRREGDDLGNTLASALSALAVESGG